MTLAIAQPKARKIRKVPDTLIYETINGRPIKIQKLLDFGVEEVVWFFTNAKKVLVAKQNQQWITVNWSDDIQILSYQLNIEQLFEAEEF